MGLAFELTLGFTLGMGHAGREPRRGDDKESFCPVN